MAILPVYTTSKLHAARINLRQTPSSNTGVLFNYVKGVVFGRKWAWFAKIFAGALRTPLHEILDPPLLEHYVWCIVCYYGVITADSLIRYQTLFVVLGSLSQVVHTITYARINPLHCWAQRRLLLL